MNPTDSEILDAVALWLPRRRWFAGKGHRVTGLAMAARHPIPGVEGAEHLIVNVHLDNAAPQTYQVPVLICREAHAASLIGQTSSGFLHDGMLHAAVVEGMLRREGAEPTEDGDEMGTELPSHHKDQAKGNPDIAPVHPQAHWVAPSPVDSGYRVLAVEQSNSSGVLGGTTLVKLFRLLIPGANPDIEVHAALQAADCADVGSLRGWMSGGWREPATNQIVHGHLAMMLQYFPDSVDGWALACRRVREGDDFSGEALRLGEATGRVHRDLRRAFPTQTLDRAGMVAMSERLQERLSLAAEVVPQIASLHEPLGVLLEGITRIDYAEVQRIHGDLHLGQVLRTSSGWRIIDFEGEPGAALDRRTALDHPMRDVAGMLRSFAYAAWQVGHDSPGARAWQERCTVAFLEGYGQVGVPVDEVLLSTYLVDKAAYEAVYEARNRPDWIEIPLSALRELAIRSQG